MLSLSKAKIIAFGVVIVLLSSLFVLWRTSVNEYKSEKKAKEALEIKLEASQLEVNNLKEYNKKISKEMERIEKENQERFQNIPKDACGDVKPSKELLEYLKKGK